VLRHTGSSVRGKKLLDAIRSGTGGGIEIACPAVKRDSDRFDFAAGEFQTARKKIAPVALRALVGAFSDDLTELAAACQQLISDVPGDITEQIVERYYGGRVETSAFTVADTAIAGRYGDALVALRHALASGADPVPLVAAIASKLRTMARVAGIRESSASLAARLGMKDWQVDRARRDLTGGTRRASVSPSRRRRGRMPRSKAPHAIPSSPWSASSRSSPPAPLRRLSAGDAASVTLRRIRPRAHPSRPVASGTNERPDRTDEHTSRTRTDDEGPPPRMRGRAFVDVDAAQRAATCFAIDDLRFAAWFSWMTPLLTALSSFLDAFASAFSAAALSPAAIASRVRRTSVFSSLLTALLRSRAFSLVLLRLICDLMFATFDGSFVRFSMDVPG
jgi:hypothetical protein